MTTRRDFLAWSAAGAGALLLPVHAGEAPASTTGPWRPSLWLEIPSTGPVRLHLPKQEMGQGVRTALPMLLAEELELDPDQLELVQAEPGPDFKGMGTAGSRSVQTLWAPLREAGARAREALRATAAARWGLPLAACRAQRGEIHGPGGRRLPYGALAQAAAARPLPTKVAPKDPRRFRLIGRPRLRVDGPALVTGRAPFTADLRLPGLQHAVLARCPVLGGKALRWDAGPALALPGVRQVLAAGDAVAVVGDHTWAALQGREALLSTIVWEEGPHAAFDSADFQAQLQAAAADGPATSVRHEGDPEAAFATATTRIAADYAYPFQAHAPLETMNAAAWVRPEGCDLWIGTQGPSGTQEAVAKALGLPLDKVALHPQLMGGAFGRKGRPDAALEAVALSRAVGGPIHLLWSRPDDMHHDYFHPASAHRLEAALNAKGHLVAWRHHIASPSWPLAFGTPAGPAQLRADTSGAFDPPYAVPNLDVAFAHRPCPLHLGPWRGIQNVHNVFARECFLDEVALAMKRDPVALRLELMRQLARYKGGRDEEVVETARLARVLERAARRCGWPKRPIGVACNAYDGRTAAAVAMELRPDGRVRRVVCVLDCGILVNPSGAKAQVEGSVVWGLSALRSRITVAKGHVQQSTYRDFPVLRLADTPDIETHFLPSAAAPSGLGEPVVPLVAPAYLNALAALTGERHRHLPLEG